MNGPHEWQPTGARDGGKRCRLCGLTNLQVKDKDQCPKAAPLKFCDDAPVSYTDPIPQPADRR